MARTMEFSTKNQANLFENSFWAFIVVLKFLGLSRMKSSTNKMQELVKRSFTFLGFILIVLSVFLVVIFEVQIVPNDALTVLMGISWILIFTTFCSAIVIYIDNLLSKKGSWKIFHSMNEMDSFLYSQFGIRFAYNSLKNKNLLIVLSMFLVTLWKPLIRVFKAFSESECIIGYFHLIFGFNLLVLSLQFTFFCSLCWQIKIRFRKLSQYFLEMEVKEKQTKIVNSFEVSLQ